MVILSNFKERLNEFMILQNVNTPKLAKLLNVSDTALNGLKRGAHYPSTEILYALITYFNCSADYLLGLSDDYPEEKRYPLPTSDFASRFNKILKETGVTQYRLTKEGNFSGNLLYKWLHGQSLPSTANLIKLANFLSVSVDYLLDRE